MKRNIYKTVAFFFTIQSILLVILVNNNYMKKYSFLQFYHPEFLELVLGLVIFFLNLAAVIVFRNLHLTDLETQHLKTTVLKYTHLVEQNRIYSQHHHDFKNHLNVVLGLLSLGKHDELRDYLNTYLRTVNDELLKIETGLDEIDVLLSSKYYLAKEKAIQLNLTIAANITCSRKYIMDLVSMLGNLIDNALEAVQYLDEPERLVNIRFRHNPLEYIFEIANPYKSTHPTEPELLLKEGFSSKQEGRGQGLFIVKRLTKKLGGNITVDPSDGQFSVTIELPKHNLED